MVELSVFVPGGPPRRGKPESPGSQNPRRLGSPIVARERYRMTEGTGVCRTEIGFVETASRRGEWARGWTIVVVSLLAYVLGATGIFFAFGVFLKPLNSEFHWSREAVSGFTAISGVMYAVASPLIGRTPLALLRSCVPDGPGRRGYIGADFR